MINNTQVLHFIRTVQVYPNTQCSFTVPPEAEYLAPPLAHTEINPYFKIGKKDQRCNHIARVALGTLFCHTCGSNVT